MNAQRADTLAPADAFARRGQAERGNPPRRSNNSGPLPGGLIKECRLCTGSTLRSPNHAKTSEARSRKEFYRILKGICQILEETRRKNPHQNPWQNSNQNLGVSRPKIHSPCDGHPEGVSQPELSLTVTQSSVLFRAIAALHHQPDYNQQLLLFVFLSN